MIPTDELILLLGKYEDAIPLQQTLSRLGNQLRPRRDDTQLSFISFPNEGMSFAYEDEATLLRKEQPLGGPSLLITVHLYSEGFEDYRQYRELLPGGLNFSDGSNRVHEKLGEPSSTGGGKRALGKLWPKWDRWDFDDYSLLTQYSQDFSKIDLVSLIAPAKVQALKPKT